MKFVPQSLFRYQSGRVIQLGRVILAALFLLSIFLDQSQPAKAPAQTYGLLILYVLFSVALTMVTWRNWWLDARLAGFSHLIDVAVFTGIIFSTDGYTSPFFLFFVLPLVSAAIRWGWRETLLTAIGLVVLYFTAGLLVAGSTAFEMQRFVVRTGHLVILSALLIWFGIHQQFTRLFVSLDQLDRKDAKSEGPLAHALAFALDASGARGGALLLVSPKGEQVSGIRMSDDRIVQTSLPRAPSRQACPVMLFDLNRDRALTRKDNGWLEFDSASKLLDVGALQGIGGSQGLLAEVDTGATPGWIVLWDMPDLSTDYIELGQEIARAAGVAINHESLLSATEEGAAARTRLSLARDVHDSVVQFLAGAAFRVEAIMRGARADSQVQLDLKELKRLLIEEQGEIRALVSALRRDRELEFAEAVAELRALAARLAQQWSVDCRVTARDGAMAIPIRLQLDLLQLLREAVANAVRHGEATRIDVTLGSDEGQLKMQITDNGSGIIVPSGSSMVQPWSLRERVERAQGSLMLFSEPGNTHIAITLPLTGAAA